MPETSTSGNKPRVRIEPKADRELREADQRARSRVAEARDRFGGRLPTADEQDGSTEGEDLDKFLRPSRSE